MIIRIKSLRGRKGERLAFSEQLDWPLHNEIPTVVEAMSLMNVLGTVTNTGDTMLVEGSLEWEVKLQCSRCLKPFGHSLTAAFSEEFYPQGSEHQTKLQADEEDTWDLEEKAVYHGDELDLSQLLWDSVLLAVPMKTLCDSECKGLCPSCGRSLNNGQCSCTSHNTDPRLAGLADLLKE